MAPTCFGNRRNTLLPAMKSVAVTMTLIMATVTKGWLPHSQLIVPRVVLLLGTLVLVLYLKWKIGMGCKGGKSPIPTAIW